MQIINDNKAKEFAVELENLLKKYSASIDWTCADCSDLHGVYDDKLVVNFGNKLAIEFDQPFIDSSSFKE